MHKLDDAQFVLGLDPKGMFDRTFRFGEQCKEAVAIAEAVDLGKLTGFQPKNVILTGMGGSAAGGDYIQAAFEDSAKVPFQVNRDYALPSYAGPDTLVLVSSYSGNTEETIASYEDAMRKGCKVIGVTSGGKLGDRIPADGWPIYRIPAGHPPRTALGYLMLPGLFACEKMGLIAPQGYAEMIPLMDACARDWGLEVPFESNPAKQLAQALHGGVGVLYGLGGNKGCIAFRWKAQINENSKNMAFYHAFPELNHNELLGWVLADKQNVQNWVVILLEDGTESAKLKRRFEVTSELIGNRATFHRVQARGESLLARMFSLTLFGDFVSLYLAALNQVDPEDITWINVLKGELAKIG